MLVLIAFTMFRPGFWWDMVYPPLEQVSAVAIYDQIDKTATDGQLRVVVEGETLDGDQVNKRVMLTMGEGESAEARLKESGLELRNEDGRLFVDMMGFGSQAEQAGIDFDWEVKALEVETDRPTKEWMFIPALLVLIAMGWNQLRRRQPS